PAGTILFLRRVGGLEPGKIQPHAFGKYLLNAGATEGHIADDQVLEVDGQIFERLVAGLANDESRALDVLAVREMLTQDRRGLVDGLYETQVTNPDLAAAAASSGVEAAALRHPPRPGQDINLILVGRVLGLAFDALDLQKYIDRHPS